MQMGLPFDKATSFLMAFFLAAGTCAKYGSGIDHPNLSSDKGYGPKYDRTAAKPGRVYNRVVEV